MHGRGVVSVAVATLATWFGNGYWTFRGRRRHDLAMELLEFWAIAAIGVGMALAYPYVCRSLFGYESLFAANVVGLGRATTFSFLMHRCWVYGDHRKHPSDVGNAPQETVLNEG